MLHSIRSPLDGFASPFGPRRRPSWLPAGAIWAYRGTDYWRNGNASLSDLMAESRVGTVLGLLDTGVYGSFAANTPIIRSTLGLDGWGAYTPVFLHSTDFSNAYWNKLNTSLPSAGAPLLETSETGEHALRRAVSFTSPPQNLAWTVRLAAGPGRTKARIIAGSGQLSCDIDLVTGVLSNQAAGGANLEAPVYAAFAEAAGVWRVEILFTTKTSINLSWQVNILDDSGNVSYAGDPAKGITPVSYQITESRFPYPLSVNAGTAVERAASNLTVVSPSNLGIANPQITMDANVDRLSSGAARTLFAAGVDADNLIRVFLDTDNRVKARLRKSASDVWTMQSGVIGSTGTKRIVVAFKPGANVLTVEGVTGATETDATALPTLTTWRLLSNFSAATPWNGNVPLMALGEAA